MFHAEKQEGPVHEVMCKVAHREIIDLTAPKQVKGYKSSESPHSMTSNQTNVTGQVYFHDSKGLLVTRPLWHFLRFQVKICVGSPVYL